MLLACICVCVWFGKQKKRGIGKTKQNNEWQQLVEYSDLEILQSLLRFIRYIFVSSCCLHIDE